MVSAALWADALSMIMSYVTNNSVRKQKIYPEQNFGDVTKKLEFCCLNVHEQSLVFKIVWIWSCYGYV